MFNVKTSEEHKPSGLCRKHRRQSPQLTVGLPVKPRGDPEVLASMRAVGLSGGSPAIKAPRQAGQEPAACTAQRASHVTVPAAHSA
jgi:hypothetical protein